MEIALLLGLVPVFTRHKKRKKQKSVDMFPKWYLALRSRMLGSGSNYVIMYHNVKTKVVVLL